MSVDTRVRFSDFSREVANLEGIKMQMVDVFGKEIYLKTYRLMDSKAVPGKTCVQLQFELDGKECVVFTTSNVLRRQLAEYKDRLPFLTTIKNMGRYHTFT